MNSIASAHNPVPPRPASQQPQARPQAQPPRQQYLDLKASVHKKLLNRLNLEALANSDRARAEGRGTVETSEA